MQPQRAFHEIETKLIISFDLIVKILRYHPGTKQMLAQKLQKAAACVTWKQEQYNCADERIRG